MIFRTHKHKHSSVGIGRGSATTRRSPGTGLFNRRARATRAPRTTRKSGGGLFSRSGRRTQKTSILPVAVSSHRKPTLGDRISGAFHKLKGSITGRTREKAIGDRLMHGRSRNRVRRQPGQHFV